jgi:hypothetical protein
MTEKSISHEESLNIIQTMIDKAKNKMSQNGFHFLLWGVLVIAASLTQYALVMQGYGNESNIVWIIMPVIGVPAGFIYEARRNKTATAEGYNDKTYSMVWLGFGIALGVGIFACVSARMSPMPIILCIVGLATFISGTIYRFKLLIIGGIVFWLAAIATVFITGPEQLLINAGATFVGYIIPGIALYNNYKKDLARV